MKRFCYPKGATLEEKFLINTFPEPNTGCWIWAGYSDKQGYGRIYSKRNYTLVHRFSYEYHSGKKLNSIEDVVCHKCNNPWCVNPDHLYVGTQAINMQQAYNQGRFGNKLYAKIPIRQLSKGGELVAIYPSIMEAFRATGISQPNISSCLNGRDKSAGGYKWERISEAGK